MVLIAPKYFQNLLKKNSRLQNISRGPGPQIPFPLGAFDTPWKVVSDGLIYLLGVCFSIVVVLADSGECLAGKGW